MMNMTRNAILLTIALGAMAFTPALAQEEPLPGEGVTVQPAVDTSVAALPFDGIFRLLLGELGYDVQEARALSNPVFYQAVAQGDVDYWANGWFPLQRAQLPPDFDEGASIVGTIIETGGVQGYLVSKDAAEEFDITSLDDFKRSEVKEAFDADGDGRADLTACPPGWGCELVIEHHLDAYDLRDHVNDLKSTYAPAFADVVARHRNGEPVFYYTWGPNFTLLELVPGEDVVWINVPEIDPSEAQEGFEDAMVVEDLEGAVTDPARLGFVVNDINVVANDQFLEENPAAHRLFELVEIPLEDISRMTARITEGEDSADDVRSMAMNWIDENREQVDAWLEEAVAAAQ